MSEFLDNLDTDVDGNVVWLSMETDNDAFLTISSGSRRAFRKALSYHLPPNEVGWNNAEKIASALTKWIQHTKSKG